MQNAHHTSVQAPPAVVMVRQHQFYSNPQTADDNTFQKVDAAASKELIAKTAYAEITQAAEELTRHGVTVHLIEDTGERDTPDSVFPNNWFSTHPGGTVALYPMYAENRRRERRHDVIELLKQQYRVHTVVDYSGYEHDNLFLEGTGAIVLDHCHRIAYVARSHRADDHIVATFCAHFGYEPVLFDTEDEHGKAVYHTNVIMCIGAQYALLGHEYITDQAQRTMVQTRLAAGGRTVLNLSRAQIGQFAGNALELIGTEGPILAMSTTARAALTDHQVATIEQSARIVALDVPTIESAGGSVRCMLAGIHLTPRS